jgi:hypothetical protein
MLIWLDLRDNRAEAGAGSQHQVGRRAVAAQLAEKAQPLPKR